MSVRSPRARNVLRGLLPLLAGAWASAGCGDGSGPTAPPDGELPPGWLGGRVIDDTGRPLAGIRVVALADTLVAFTGADGTFAIGPFADGDTATLMTESPDTVSAAGSDDAWYDCVTGPLAVAGDSPVAITLLTRYAIELAGPGSWLPSNDHFSHFLEYTTNGGASATGPNISWTWDSYPLAVHVRDTLIVHPQAPADTIDAGSCVRAALSRWNEAFGYPVLVETADRAGAEVVCSYPVLGSTLPGQAGPEDADECGFRTCPPTRVEVRLSSVFIPDATAFTNIAVHEFGHALGFWGHISSSRMIVENGARVFTVMTQGGGTGGHPIHPFELRAIVAKHHLPQGTVLENYEGTAPDFADFPPWRPGAGKPEVTP